MKDTVFSWVEEKGLATVEELETVLAMVGGDYRNVVNTVVYLRTNGKYKSFEEFLQK